MRILIFSDAWYPQVNGVVRTLDTTQMHLERLGHFVEVVGPNRFRCVPLPTYKEIRLALVRPGVLAREIDVFEPDAIHIATEGPLGWAARRACLSRGLHFTTSFHTLFPLYVRLRLGIPESWTYAVLRRFHSPANAIMVATNRMEELLRDHGFDRITRWARGVDTDLFQPRETNLLAELPRPIQLYVGRIAVEKDLDRFLALKTAGSQVIVGDGPARSALEKNFPHAHFVGAKFGEELAQYYAAADVFVFPSASETFGLVMLEAMACGVPVAAYPVQGPLDILAESRAGAMDKDLGRAIVAALTISPKKARARALDFSWARSTRQFIDNLTPVRHVQEAKGNSAGQKK